MQKTGSPSLLPPERQAEGEGPNADAGDWSRKFVSAAAAAWETRGRPNVCEVASNKFNKETTDYAVYTNLKMYSVKKEQLLRSKTFTSQPRKSQRRHT
jgi:hypothetical protein